MRVMRLWVEVPSDGQYRRVRFGRKTVRLESTRKIDTRVFVIRRLLGGGKGTARHVEVEAFIPLDDRAGLAATDPRWVDYEAGILRTVAYLDRNWNTLRPLLSGPENVWRFPDETAAA